uniref:Nucleotidyl transferase n=1 Tax=viral metagenome TaxID=1070528 RepID=A0A6C0JUK9_9ZZZZ
MEEIAKLQHENTEQIKYKEKLAPAVFKYISFVNKNLVNFKGDKDYIRRLKLIIGGGAAFNYFIKRTKKTSVLETHDFDLRLYLDIKPSDNPLFSEDPDIKQTTEIWMLEICTAIGDGFSDFLNKYVEEVGLRRDNISPFHTVYRGFLTTVEYTIDGENDSLIDIVGHLPSSQAVFYGPLEIEKDRLFQEYKEKDFRGISSRNGFFKTSMIYVRDTYGIYYVSLGYLVWDTVRMLNYIIDSGRTLKFERYLYKYKILLAALSRPELYMNCHASRKFIKACQDTIRVCNVDGETFKNKDTLIDKGVSLGLLPMGKDWRSAFSKMDFADLCKAIISE